MSADDFSFTVKKFRDCIIIENKSPYDLIISLIPIKPALKYWDIHIIKSGHTSTFDNIDISLERCCFRLVMKDRLPQ